ncbi:uncharacterized protein YkwD [Kitasatospora sp. GAS204A]|uniref:CAP domain-containing protein n=1 Tax=unclassified Kitasatospora TaxID=2633591 RepID=UPI0024757EA0|nr:CAP domain-containing protein [Kitasatospora sp. GAS204B]MDH6118883.1 uncharacterized protein YkwD [Kitasatospora sp. GAS204B]
MPQFTTGAESVAQPWGGEGPAGWHDPGAAARRPGGGAHRRVGNGRHRARRAVPGAKPLLAAVAVAATAASAVIGGGALTSGPRDGKPLSAPEPPPATDALASTASGSPAGAPAVSAAPAPQTTGPTRLPGPSASTTPVNRPTTAAPSSAPTPADSQTAAASQTPSGPAPSSSSSTVAVPAPVPAPSSTAAGAPGSDLDAAAAQVLAVINQARAAQGVAPLQMLAGLRTSADAHNHTMAAGCGLQHQCPGEPAFGARENAGGVQWTTAGENIGEGGPVAGTTAAIAGMAVGLTNSMLAEQPPNDGHRRNILDPAFHHIGIELLRDSSGTVWMTQDFAD